MLITSLSNDKIKNLIKLKDKKYRKILSRRRTLSKRSI